MRRRILLATGAALLAAPALAQPRRTIGVALASDTNPFYIAMRRGIATRAGELGYDTAFVTANEVVGAQVDGIGDLVARRVAGILCSPIDAVAVGGAYAGAARAGIPVISVARGAESPAQTLYVSMDEPRIGREIAEWIGRRVGGRGKVAMIGGPSGAATFRNLSAGFEAGLRAQPGLELVYRHDVALTREMGLKEAEDILVAHPDVVAIYAANDEVALGAVQAVAAANRAGQVVVTGLNGIPPALRAVRAGTLGLTVELNPAAWGRLGVEVMDRHLRGEPVPPGELNIHHLLVDRDNVDAVLNRPT